MPWIETYPLYGIEDQWSSTKRVLKTDTCAAVSIIALTHTPLIRIGTEMEPAGLIMVSKLFKWISFSWKEVLEKTSEWPEDRVSGRGVANSSDPWKWHWTAEVGKTASELTIKGSLVQPGVTWSEEYSEDMVPVLLDNTQSLSEWASLTGERTCKSSLENTDSGHW